MNRSKEFSVTSATTLFSEEVRAGDAVASVQIANPGTTCTVTYEMSNDGTTWVGVTGNAIGVGGAQVGPTTTAAGINVFMVQARFFRARVSTYGSGTVSGVVTFGEGWTK